MVSFYNQYKGLPLCRVRSFITNNKNSPGDLRPKEMPHPCLSGPILASKTSKRKAMRKSCCTCRKKASDVKHHPGIHPRPQTPGLKAFSRFPCMGSSHKGVLRRVEGKNASVYEAKAEAEAPSLVRKSACNGLNIYSQETHYKSQRGH